MPQTAQWGRGGTRITGPVEWASQRLSSRKGVERKEVRSLQTVERLELPAKQMQQAGWRRALRAWAGTGEGPAEPHGKEGLVALAERLVRGYLPENQDGEFFPPRLVLLVTGFRKTATM